MKKYVEVIFHTSQNSNYKTIKVHGNLTECRNPFTLASANMNSWPPRVQVHEHSVQPNLKISISHPHNAPGTFVSVCSVYSAGSSTETIETVQARRL